MSYKVLSRKWRPQLFYDVIGQNHVTKTLQNAIQKNRVAHGYLFSGPRGVGKTTTARILAKTLNCENVTNNNPCNKCMNCKNITMGSCLNVQELDGASNRGIDEIRELREAVKYPPSNGKYRIFIIDEVHMLTKEAFNALLKTLEEPPSHIIFIMATTDDHKVPITIRSRTQKFDFKLISKDKISNFLIKILNNEKINHDDGIDKIAQKANGSLRDALSLLDQVIVYSNDNLDETTILNVLGIIEENSFLNILNFIHDGNNKDLTIQINQLLNDGYSIFNFISGFNDFIRNCMLYKSNNSKTYSLSTHSIKWLNSKCQYDIKNIIEILDLTLQFEARLKQSIQPKIALELLLLKLIFINNDSKTIENNTITIQKKNGIHDEKKPPSTYQEESNISLKTNLENKKQTVSNDNELTLNHIKKTWGEFLIKLEEKNSKLSHFLEDSKLISFNDKKIVIELLDGNQFQQSSLEKDINQIEDIFNEKYNEKVEFKIILNDSIKSEATIKKETTIKKNKATEHPLFNEIMEKFDGEIIR